jgi:hypothetical protein
MGINRRNFIKAGGLLSGAIGLGGIAGAGLAAGKDPNSYTGWSKNNLGKDQFFDREPFYTDEPVHVISGETRRITYLEDIFKRNRSLYKLLYSKDPETKWSPEMGVEALPDDLRNYFTENPESLKEFFLAQDMAEEQHKNWEKYKGRYALADAWSSAHASVLRGRGAYPANPDCPPEEWDFKDLNPDKMAFKTPKHASDL